MEAKQETNCPSCGNNCTNYFHSGGMISESAPVSSAAQVATEPMEEYLPGLFNLYTRAKRGSIFSARWRVVKAMEKAMLESESASEVVIPEPDAPDSITGLLPCPFCGSKAYYTESVNGSRMVYAGCSECGIAQKAQKVGDNPTKDVKAAWNKRVAASRLTAQQELMNRLREFAEFLKADFSEVVAHMNPIQMVLDKRAWRDRAKVAEQALSEAGRTIETLRERMVNQVRALLKQSVVCWNLNSPHLANANDEKGRFLWQFMPDFRQDEFDAEFKAIGVASGNYVERLAGDESKPE